uniref:Heat-shock protein 20 n=1 Tax=Eimeria stiedai TaxID=471275 RepID=A0A8K1P7V2_9EIME|nr:heat-shock protein 20 [Eimeria stiedai]
MIERGEATWDEVKTYLREHGPQYQGPSGPTLGSSSYTYSAGYWYPLTHGGAFTAAPNTVFEVACGDPEATKRISLRPQVDVVFDAKASQLVFAFDLPGFEKKDVSVEVENRCIAVSGEFRS